MGLQASKMSPRASKIIKKWTPGPPKSPKIMRIWWPKIKKSGHPKSKRSWKKNFKIPGNKDAARWRVLRAAHWILRGHAELFASFSRSSWPILPKWPYHSEQRPFCHECGAKNPLRNWGDTNFLEPGNRRGSAYYFIATQCTSMLGHFWSQVAQFFRFVQVSILDLNLASS